MFEAAMTKNLQAYLSSAWVAKEVFDLRPDYRVLLLAIDGIVPRPSDSTSEALLVAAEAHAKDEVSARAVTEIPHVAAWRDAYKAFGGKPQKNRNSLEALTRRAATANGLPRVNRLTDVYNAISVTAQIPFGGEDLDKYSGAPRCVRATGKEPFVFTSAGQQVTEYPDVGEVVWADDAGVTCRRWNWRQGPRTALTDETTGALFILDALSPVTDEALLAAGDELVERLKEANPELEVARRVIGKEEGKEKE